MSETSKTVQRIIEDATLSASAHIADVEAAVRERQYQEAALLIEEIEDQFDEFDVDPLEALGLELQPGEGMFMLSKGRHTFIVEPGPDGSILANGTTVRFAEKHYTDALYYAVFQLIYNWAVKLDDEAPSGPIA